MSEIPTIKLDPEEAKKDALGLGDRDNILTKLNNLRFYLKTPQQASRALLFAKKLREFADLVEDKVKKRGSEIMDEQNLFEMEMDGFMIKRIEPTTTNDYRASSVIEGLGMERAVAFLKVATAPLEKYIMKARIEGDELTKINIGRKEKNRSGYIRVSEIKEKKEDKK
jgi:hypothetical protein